jgi:formylglycine-generating enzyme required for sulfatase activity
MAQHQNEVNGGSIMNPTPVQGAKTFVSYAREDAEFVLKLAADLRQAGANIWLDQLDIPPGTRWDRAVEQALEECPRLLVILSPASVTSDNVLDEVHYALDEGKAVIPVLHRDCKIPLRLRRLQRLVVGTGIAELLTALGFEREVASPQPGAVKPKPADEYVRDDTPVAPLLTPEVERILAELQSESTSHARRSEIGQRLAEIGDPRRGVGVMDGVPDILWRPIPGGEVEIEDRGRFAVAPFHMAAFPVTFGQFRAFLEVKDGYDNKRWWKDLRREDRNPAWQSPLANHPVTSVSWYDATAFCCWLSARVGFEVRLPDEQEWQWAAQSARAGFTYPWGPNWREGLANTDESDLSGATAVGMYPHGDSLQKVSDLAGNVWEWCRNEYKTGSGSRVLRGGAWYSRPGLARADLRLHRGPFARLFYLGFRVVCSSPIR